MHPISSRDENDSGEDVHICNGIFFSHRQNEIMPLAATGMDLESVTLSY